MPEPIVARTTRLPASTWASLEEQAKSEKRSVNNLVEVLVDEGLYRRLWAENDARHEGAPK
jgi:hypothetical protein